MLFRLAGRFCGSGIMTKRKSLANPSKYPENFQGKCKRKSEKTKKRGQKSQNLKDIK
jgi:hypothetical protein